MAADREKGYHWIEELLVHHLGQQSRNQTLIGKVMVGGVGGFVVVVVEKNHKFG